MASRAAVRDVTLVGGVDSFSKRSSLHGGALPKLEENNMANEVTKVVVSVHVASSNPILPIIEVVEAIRDGAGVLIETIFGGQVSLRLELATGHEVRPLKQGEFVYIRGERNGAPFVITGPFTTDKPSKPWQFSRTSGSTGP
jgi:hypothetical protein